MAELTSVNFIAAIKAMNARERNALTKQKLLDLILEAEVNNIENQRLEQRIADLELKYEEIKGDVRQNTVDVGNFHGQIQPLLINALPNPKINELEIAVIS